MWLWDWLWGTTPLIQVLYSDVLALIFECAAALDSKTSCAIRLSCKLGAENLKVKDWQKYWSIVKVIGDQEFDGEDVTMIRFLFRRPSIHPNVDISTNSFYSIACKYEKDGGNVNLKQLDIVEGRHFVAEDEVSYYTQSTRQMFRLGIIKEKPMFVKECRLVVITCLED